MSHNYKFHNPRSYVFLFNNHVEPATGSNITINDAVKLGDMPINRKWGYMFDISGAPDARTLARTLAHELGHGRLTLRHTFATEHCGGTSGHTNNHNLMDYPSASSGQAGTGLNRFQWEAIHNPAIIGKMFQDDEDGAYKPGYYVAIHDFKGECDNGANIDEEFITYFAPSGLPFSLPKRVCQEKHTGKVVLTGSTKIIEIPDKCLTSFKLDEIVYEAFVIDGEFIGYIPFPTGNVDIPFKDEYTIPNLATIELYDLSDSYINRKHIAYKSMGGFEGDYFAKGPLIVGDGFVLRCLKCQMPIEECYCGKACVCYSHEPDPKSGVYLDYCFRNRSAGLRGIPYFQNGHLEKIEYLRIVQNNNDLLHNVLLNEYGYELYCQRIGNSSSSISIFNVIEGIGYLSEVGQKLTEDPVADEILGGINLIYAGYGLYSSMSNINQAIDNGNFGEAFYEGLKLFPGFGSIAGTAEKAISFVYSEPVMQTLYNSSDAQLNVLYNSKCNDANCLRMIAELEKFKNITDEQLTRLRLEKFEDVHNNICTCFK